MPRVHTEVMGGRTVIYQDFRDLHTIEDARTAFDESRAAVKLQPQGSVLILTDFSGTRFTPDMVEAAKSLASDNRPWVKKSALVGLSQIQQVLFTGVNRAADRQIRWFTGMDEARAWLVAEEPVSA